MKKTFWQRAHPIAVYSLLAALLYFALRNAPLLEIWAMLGNLQIWQIFTLLGLTRHLAWLTVNFDGLTALEPPIDPALDEQIERLYHATMDSRTTGGRLRLGGLCPG